MKRIALLAFATTLVVSCEKPTEPGRLGVWASTSSSPSTSFSGEATVVGATVLNVPVMIGHAGPLPESGGAEESSLITVSPNETGGMLGAEAVHAATVGQGRSTRSEASVLEVNLTASGNTIHADLLQSRAEATCDGSGAASASGSSEVAGLVINGQAIEVSAQPNQTVNLPNGKVVINEQTQSASGNQADIKVSALHVIVFNPLGGPPLADVVISSAHAGISCAGCPEPVGDFVTGGGWITGTPSGAKANFAVAGGMKNGVPWGHLTYIDHGPNGPKVRGTGVTGYKVDGLTRHIEGTAEIDGAAGTYVVDVVDNGEPGREDEFHITLSTLPDYKAGDKLGGGNIKLHERPSPCP